MYFALMNFLSHYYFDRHTNNANIVIGAILPDLVKNAHKEWNLHPQKKEELFIENPILNDLLLGWKRHLQVDLIFHSSDFFKDKTAELKDIIIPVTTNTEIRPSFLAHIGVELLLDNILIEQSLINVNNFYSQLNKADNQQIKIFLEKCGVAETEVFFTFLNSFLSSKYLLSYQKIENITYALNRICMRIWPNPFNETQLSLLTKQLIQYKKSLATDFISIFEDIEAKLH